MRWLNRLVLLLLLLLIAQQWLFPNIKSLLVIEQGNGQLLEQARTSNYYPLTDDNWLEFGIANQTRIYRFYFHAALRSQKNQGPNDMVYQLKPQHSYQVTYQWLSGNNDVLSTHEYNINTRVSPNITIMTENIPSKMKQVPLRFYNHPDLQPSLDQSLYLNPSSEPKARTVRFKVTEMDSSIDYIGVRPYLQYHRNPQDRDIAWQRMSREKRDLISSPSVYPSFLISGLERQNLMAKYWKPIGPLGVLNQDYRIETLYLRENTLPLPPTGEITPKGLFASPFHWASVRLTPKFYDLENQQRYDQDTSPAPEETQYHQYKLQWHDTLKTGFDALPSQIMFHWQGENTKQNQQWQDSVTNGIWQGKLKNGLLKIVPNEPGIFTVSKKVNDQWLDITPKVNRIRPYLCEPNHPLIFDLGLVDSFQSLKVTGRGFIRTGEISTNANTSINITTFDQRNDIFNQYAMVTNEQINPYVHFDDSANVKSQIYESVSRYFDLSKSITHFRVTCSSPVLINASTRPLRHPINRNLPAEHNPWLTYETREPAWFSLQPKNRELLIVNKQFFSLLWYFAPIETRSDNADHRLTWQALPVVEDDAYEKQLFSSVAKTNIRQQTKSISYRPVTGKENLEFSGKHDQAAINVSAVYLRNTPSPQTIEVWIDEQLSLRTTIAGYSGKISIPSVKPGEHSIQFKSKNINWYVNNMNTGPISHVIRSAHTLTYNAINQPSSTQYDYPYSLTFKFDINKPPQTISIWLFAPQSTKELKCHVRLDARHLASNQATHSFRDYHYTITSNDYPLSKVLQQKDDALHGPIPLYFALNEDMPDQRAQMILRCNQANVLASGGIISEDISSFYHFKERIDEP